MKQIQVNGERCVVERYIYIFEIKRAHETNKKLHKEIWFCVP